MCGIFGYTGSDAAPGLFVESLKRMEYRGYDSWGIALGEQDELDVVRNVGRIGIVDGTQMDGSHEGACWGGIAHTRWATHGAPTVPNAHPHADCTGRIAIVHNGIIENHSALRDDLTRKGHEFRSETDSEVVAHLIEEFVSDGLDVHMAFLSAMRLLEGAYGIAMVSADAPGRVFVARHGSPMVLGIGEDSTMVASDPAALIPFTRSVIYLEDGEAACLDADGYETHDLNAVPVTKQVQQLAFDLPAIERRGYPHFMLKEIHEQPETLRNAMRGRLLEEEGTARLNGIPEEVLRRVERIHILACGTSWHAGLVGKYLLENIARVPTVVSYAAEFRYINPVVEPGTLFVAISQSGETADTLAGLREAKLRGADVAGIVNVVGSTIAREAGQGIYLHAGPEIGVASTKAFTSQIVVLSLLALHMGRLRDMPLRQADELIGAIKSLPDKAEQALECNEVVEDLAHEYMNSPNFLYIGRLYEYPLALEGALKLKEISYLHAEGIPAAELKHGPIALIDNEMPTVVLAAQTGILDKMISNVEEIRARGGRILAVVRDGEDSLDDLSEHIIRIPAVPDPLVPIIGAIPLQLLAYHIAVQRGCDVDHPRNLAKSVTVE